MDRRTAGPEPVEPGRYTSDDLDRIAAWKYPADMHEPPVLDDEPDCEHGLSAWLCAGPMHYPEGS